MDTLLINPDCYMNKLCLLCFTCKNRTNLNCIRTRSACFFFFPRLYCWVYISVPLLLTWLFSSTSKCVAVIAVVTWNWHVYTWVEWTSQLREGQLEFALLPRMHLWDRLWLFFPPVFSFFPTTCIT